MTSYKITGVLGEGGQGVVFRAWRTSDSKNVAIKYRPIKHIVNWTDERHPHPYEVKMLKTLTAVPGVINYIESFVDHKDYAIITELAEGETLFQTIQRHPHLTEKEMACIVMQLTLILKDCHNKGVAHLDLKPENIINNHGVLKLIDFGLAREFEKDKHYDYFCGTRGFTPPEVIYHTPHKIIPREVFGIGATLVDILGTDNCFIDKHGLVKFLNHDRVSRKCIVLIKKMCHPVPALRPSLDAILNDGWFVENLKF